MASLPLRADQPTQSERSAAQDTVALRASRPLRIGSLTVRSIFIIVLLLIIARVSLPQNETILTAYDTPLDLVRVILGLAACIWIAVQLFALPKGAQAYRTWLYLGLTALPFALICLYFVW